MLIRSPSSSADLLSLVQPVRLGNPIATMTILKHNRSRLRNICRRHLGRGLDFDDLLQEAQMGFLYGVRLKYIPGPGHTDKQLISYCSRWAKRAVRRAIQNTGSLIRVPIWLQDELGRRRSEPISLNGSLLAGSQVLAGPMALPDDDQLSPGALHNPFDRMQGDRARRLITARALRSLGLVHRVVLTRRAQDELGFEEIGLELRRRGLREDTPTFWQVRHLYRVAVNKVRTWMRRHRIGAEALID